jgi:uncharacterized protein DUF4242
MPVYMVERDLPGVKMEQLAAAQKRAIEVGKELTAQGKEVRYIRSTFVPGQNKCMCLFEAPNPENVREANERAQIPFTRIVDLANALLVFGEEDCFLTSRRGDRHDGRGSVSLIGYLRQVDFKRGSSARFAIHPNVTAALFHDAKYRASYQAIEIKASAAAEDLSVA